MRRLVASMLGVTLVLAIGSALHVSAQRANPNASRSRQPSANEARLERTGPFSVGETLTPHVTWSALLTAGKVVAEVKEKKPSYGSTAYYVVAEGRPTLFFAKLYPVYYK